MNSKMLIFGIAVLSVGLFAMPSTVALLSGQHSFVEYNANSTTISCTGCHGDVAVTGIHTNRTQPVTGTLIVWSSTLADSKDAQCRGCHVPGLVNTNLLIPLNGTVTNLSAINEATVHIAKRATCTNCHDLAYSRLTGSGPDAHRPLNDSAVNANGNITYIQASDRACITCHTQAGISGANFTELIAKANYNTSLSKDADGKWNVTYS